MSTAAGYTDAYALLDYTIGTKLLLLHFILPYATKSSSPPSTKGQPAYQPCKWLFGNSVQHYACKTRTRLRLGGSQKAANQQSTEASHDATAENTQPAQPATAHTAQLPQQPPPTAQRTVAFAMTSNPSTSDEDENLFFQPQPVNITTNTVLSNLSNLFLNNHNDDLIQSPQVPLPSTPTARSAPSNL
ncbi:hypothetical protein CVT24_000417 [Panaeolus cyanescens]|uniref:Uncharacterized protein n=1 Tax=Panaeolus cyanescens TaxID=181874 RepID=A0A409WP66_9AGAR|nr:hypothetical protein CVT24_000417 [Panaeolus cyanescens]